MSVEQRYWAVMAVLRDRVPVVEVERRFARSTDAYVSSTHSVTISATGWILTWRVTPSTAPLKL